MYLAVIQFQLRRIGYMYTQYILSTKYNFEFYAV